MKILVIGKGGREHALSGAFKKDGHEVYCLPGSDGMAGVIRVDYLEETDIDGIVKFAKENSFDLVVIGPEAPLELGLADALRAAGLNAFGPGKNEAQWETSKVYSKKMMKKYGIPTADFFEYSCLSDMIDEIDGFDYPYVVKKDGLAAGKGVYIINDELQKKNMLEAIRTDEGKYIIEEYLDGEEVSVLSVCDGKKALILPITRDYKKLNEGNLGPNTGGMGAIGPIKLSEKVMSEVESVVNKTLNAMKSESQDYRGIIYAGLILSSKGVKVLEYNARFGDPETEALVHLIDDDWAELCLQASKGNLLKEKIRPSKIHACCVIMSSENYPYGKSEAQKITGLDKTGGVFVYHAGTELKDGDFYATGGRVLAVVATGESLRVARDKAYNEISNIDFKGAHYRKDIGSEV